MKTYKSLSIFQNLKESDIFLKPSPHIVIRNCLDQNLYNDLENTFPSDQDFQKIIHGTLSRGFDAENTRFSLNASLALKNKDRISEVWIEFIKYHISKNFFYEVNNIFDKFIYQYYPDLKKKFKNIKNLKTTTRFDNFDTESNLNLECQIAVNTPSLVKSSVIDPHTDGSKELYAGLLYFRNSNDISKGGDLITHKWKSNERKNYIYGYMVKKNLIEKVNLIKYEKNTLVFFLNTIDFIHSVSPREPSKYSRRFVNILADIPIKELKNEPLYPISYAWGGYKIKLFIRNLFLKLGILKVRNVLKNLIKKFF